jgi:hypothetical protein
VAKQAALSTLSAGFFDTAKLNTNFTNLNAALNNTLSLDGSTPNSMLADFDMNSNRILNVADPVVGSDGVPRDWVTSYITNNLLDDIFAGESPIDALALADRFLVSDASDGDDVYTTTVEDFQDFFDLRYPAHVQATEPTPRYTGDVWLDTESSTTVALIDIDLKKYIAMRW